MVKAKLLKFLKAIDICFSTIHPVHLFWDLRHTEMQVALTVNHDCLVIACYHRR